jgi:hypothetical protein
MIKIALSKLGNDELYTFGIRIENLLSKFNVELLGILLYVNLFLSKLVIYSKSYEKQSAGAKVVEHKDSIRDNYFLALRTHVENFKRHDTVEKRQASSKLLAILNKDGKGIYKESYSVESASLETTIKKFDLNHSADLELLMATEWYQLMKAAQIDFETTLSKVIAEVADKKVTASASNTRKPLEEAIRKLFNFLPLHQEMTDSPELADMIRRIQTECDRF